MALSAGAQAGDPFTPNGRRSQPRPESKKNPGGSVATPGFSCHSGHFQTNGVLGQNLLLKSECDLNVVATRRPAAMWQQPNCSCGELTAAEQRPVANQIPSLGQREMFSFRALAALM